MIRAPIMTPVTKPGPWPSRMTHMTDAPHIPRTASQGYCLAMWARCRKQVRHLRPHQPERGGRGATTFAEPRVVCKLPHQAGHEVQGPHPGAIEPLDDREERCHEQQVEEELRPSERLHEERCNEPPPFASLEALDVSLKPRHCFRTSELQHEHEAGRGDDSHGGDEARRRGGALPMESVKIGRARQRSPDSKAVREADDERQEAH